MSMISAALETLEERSEKRRKLPRRRLRLNVAADAGAGGSTEVVVHDLSVNGLLLESRAPLSADETITVELPEAPAAVAKVVWTSGDFYGCQFSRPIPVAAVSASLLMSPAEKSKPPGAAVEAVPAPEAPAIPAPVAVEAPALDRLPVFDDSAERGNLASGARIWIVVAIAVGLWFILLKAIGLL